MNYYSGISPPITKYLTRPVLQYSKQHNLYNEIYEQKQEQYQPTYCNQVKDEDIRLIAYAFNEEILFRKELQKLSNQLIKYEPNLLQLFQMFVTDSAYKIEKFRFIEILQSYQDDIKVCDVELLFNQLNNYKIAQSITFAQFNYLLLKNCKYHKEFDVSDLKYKQDLAPQIQIELMMRILKMNLQMLSTIEYMRQRIEKSLCNLPQLFEYIDKDRNGLIKAFEIVKLIQESLSHPVTVEEAAMILNDMNEQGQLAIQQFINYFKPKSAAIYL